MGLSNLICSAKDNNDELQVMLEYMLSSANELDEIIKNITNKTLVANYPVDKLI
nr:hypothetical protein [Mucilaginibacter sp. E4BP6]